MNQASPTPYRVVTYNILLGGMGRLDPIYETFLYLNADLIAMTECDDPDAVAYLANKLGLEYALAEAAGSDHHVAVMSKAPIGQMINLSAITEGLTHGALEAVIDRPSGPLRVIAAHLPYGLSAEAESQRLAELERILGAAEAPDESLLLGTLNAAAPYHVFNASNLPPDTPCQAPLATAVVDRLTELGYVDGLRRGAPELDQPTYSTGYPALTPDYVFLPASLGDRVKAAHVETGGFAPYCSDHYAVCCDLDLG
ncbi:MAG: endonuclease/exonuclease/phosphatase family protein [Planctomycetota bacterium]|jgi:endonuclease/exonuclease/phosphatase family metal-dependent hydrolase